MGMMQLRSRLEAMEEELRVANQNADLFQELKQRLDQVGSAKNRYAIKDLLTNLITIQAQSQLDVRAEQLTSAEDALLVASKREVSLTAEV